LNSRGRAHKFSTLKDATSARASSPLWNPSLEGLKFGCCLEPAKLAAKDQTGEVSLHVKPYANRHVKVYADISGRASQPGWWAPRTRPAASPHRGGRRRGPSARDHPARMPESSSQVEKVCRRSWGPPKLQVGEGVGSAGRLATSGALAVVGVLLSAYT
jgi:hypothetical protein